MGRSLSRSLPLALLLIASPATADGPREITGPDPEPLPAGVYWHSQSFGGCEHDECEPPQVAVVLGRPGSVDAATRAARRASVRRVALGYPFLAHTDELGTPRSFGQGVAVVVGLFADRDDARSWAARRGGGLRVVEVSDPYERHPEGDWSPRRVIEVEREATAWDAGAVTRIVESVGDDVEAGRAFRALRPICTLPAGTAFVTRDPYSSAGNPWAPALCGGRAAVVRVDRVRFRAVVLRDRDSGATLAQVVDGACDTPEIVKWRYSRDGREAIRGEEYVHPVDARTAAARSSCGGPS